MPPPSPRPFIEADVPELLELMRGLARFEGYIDDFAVTEADLRRHGLGPEPRFEAWVVDSPLGEGGLAGMAVTYRIPWSYDLRPTLILKELYVREEARGRGVGEALLRAVARRALDIDCPRIQWTVLSSNEAAQRFYRKLRGFVDPAWQSWQLDAAGIEALARED